MKARIYHNPRCSKSRATLGLLESRGLDLEIIDYLNDPPSKARLRQLLGKLGIGARHLVRSGEPEYSAADLPSDATDDQLLDLIVQHPKLLQRPIVEIGARARIGRPPEQVLELLE